MLLKVENMSCQHCVRSVTAALRALDAEARVEVDLARGEVLTDGKFDAEAAIQALADADYPARLLTDADPV
ncbi:heavy-metal-associated domain-containing protein [Thermomonas sp.]|jgi:copper chaperone|uniref:heavy-metal-associated domain-containing protein n=1 Tax=Thermomonas sp. TaxID=1971895 RepID=UPI001ACFE9E5|nr:heavy-metal-associated domain-containing protein [Xanthomonadales bacterium]MBN8794856.1 heavy-metal-associated domain-containing protein [Stenotrophomonas nitritireducens]